MLSLYLLLVGLAIMSFQVHVEEILPWSMKGRFVTLRNCDQSETNQSLRHVTLGRIDFS